MIIAGFGFRRAATLDSLLDAYARVSCDADGLATAADKANSAIFRNLATRLNLPVVAVSSPSLIVQNTHTQSKAALASRGTGSVAEAAALAAAGPGATLLTTRIISTDHMATCALAKGDFS